MKSTNKVIRITPAQVKSEKGGWVTFIDGKGDERKARKSQVLISESDGLRRIGNKRHDCRSYESATTAEGNSSLDCADEVAVKYRGVPLDKVYSDVAKVLKVTVTELRNRYAHLNQGMQRMNLGNRLRAALKEAA